MTRLYIRKDGADRLRSDDRRWLSSAVFLGLTEQIRNTGRLPGDPLRMPTAVTQSCLLTLERQLIPSHY